MSWLVDSTQSILSGALEGLTRRQAVISSNLANIDTPGYQPKAVDFETALRAEVQAAQSSPADLFAPMAGPSADVALRTTDSRHLGLSDVSNGAPDAAAESFDGSLRNDRNKVDLESEMTALSETQLKFEAVTRLENGKFSQLLDVIGGR